MSIASPRPSLNLPSSQRTSIDTTSSARSPSTSRAPSVLGTTTTEQPQKQRRNRAALREFYNLQPSNPNTTDNTTTSTSATTSTSTLVPSAAETDPLSALDDPNFNAQTYTSSLLQSSDPKSLLKTLNLISTSALGLEGDKKALVYDNYTTLLAATGTISRMRQNVDPMAPVTTTLEPAVGHIVDTARAIAGGRGSLVEGKEKGKDGDGEGKGEGLEKKKETVRWVLGARDRLRKYKDEGKDEEARSEWEEVRSLLVKWQAVDGVKEVREACEQVMDNKTED